MKKSRDIFDTIKYFKDEARKVKKTLNKASQNVYHDEVVTEAYYT